ncbi:hypothetical protein BRD17_07495 [Halobacteriales archaeon SW_7_68_16]|nr:MAG: hypothetical protein BRD17_07495 [Halobacteriales archaeon SW_7_68_16]
MAVRVDDVEPPQVDVAVVDKPVAVASTDDMKRGPGFADGPNRAVERLAGALLVVPRAFAFALR